MSTTKLFRAGLFATVGVAGLTLAANAQSRYGNIYDYESGRNCGQACTVPAAAPTTSRYGAPVVAAPTYAPAPVYNPAPVYIDCVQAGTCAPQAATVYTQPTQTYSAPSYTAPASTYTQSVQAPPANCPSGTIAQSDGTCMQTSSSSTTSHLVRRLNLTEPVCKLDLAFLQARHIPQARLIAPRLLRRHTLHPAVMVSL